MPLTMEQARAELSSCEARAAVLERIRTLQNSQVPPYGATYSATSSKGSDERSVSSNGGTPTYVFQPASPIQHNVVQAAENMHPSVHDTGRAVIRVMQHTLEAAADVGEFTRADFPVILSEAQSLKETPRSATIRYTPEQLLEARRIHDEVTRGGGKNSEYQKKLNRHIISKPTVTRVTKLSPKPSHPSPVRRVAFRSTADLAKAAATSLKADQVITPRTTTSPSFTAPSTPSVVQQAPAPRIVQEPQAFLQAPRTPLLKAVSNDPPPTPPSVSQHIVRAMSNLTISDMISGGSVKPTHGRDAIFEEKTNEACGQAVQDRNKDIDSSTMAAKQTMSSGSSTTTIAQVNGAGEKRQESAATTHLHSSGLVNGYGLSHVNGHNEHLKALLKDFEDSMTDLRHRVIDLERNNEMYKFVGTQGGRTPFMVEVSYPDGDARRIQTFGEMRVNRLLERIVREKGIQNSIDSASLKHGADELGHLAMVGEYDLGEGHQLVFTHV